MGLGLGMAGAGDGPANYKRRHGDSYEYKAQQAKARRFARANQVDLAGMLRQMLDKNPRGIPGQPGGGDPGHCTGRIAGGPDC